MKKKLAIIIPAYNCEKDIEKCLISILKQSDAHTSIIVVDDGSNDSTGGIIKSKYPEVIYFYQDNQGVSAARNKALDFAVDYEYIMFVDADDWLEDHCLETIRQILHQNSPDYLFFDWNEYKIISNEYGTVHYKMNASFTDQVTIENIRNHLLRSRSGGCPWGKVFKNDVIQKHHIRFLKGLPYAEDYLFNLDFLKHAESVIYLPEPLYVYNCMNIGARAKFRKNFAEITLRIEDYKFKHYSDSPESLQRMKAELVDQFAAVVRNLGNKAFSKKEKKAEYRKLYLFLKKQGMKVSGILRTKTRFRNKCFCMLIMLRK